MTSPPARRQEMIYRAPHKGVNISDFYATTSRYPAFPRPDVPKIRMQVSSHRRNGVGQNKANGTASGGCEELLQGLRRSRDRKKIFWKIAENQRIFFKPETTSHPLLRSFKSRSLGRSYGLRYARFLWKFAVAANPSIEEYTEIF